MNGHKLQVVDKIPYLGSTLSILVHIDDEVNAITTKANLEFARLRANIWERNGIRLDPKLKVYKTVVLSYIHLGPGQYTKVMYAKRHNHFHLKLSEFFLNIFF